MAPGRFFALITGVIYLVMGLMGFVPSFVAEPTTLPDYVAELGVHSGFGYLMGLFPINTPHNIVHLVVGAVGILASISLDSSRWFAGFLGIFYGLLTVMGLIPVANTTFGLIPIYGNDVWLHAITAAIAIYFGFIATPNLRQLLNQGKVNNPQEMPAYSDFQIDKQ